MDTGMPLGSVVGTFALMLFDQQQAASEFKMRDAPTSQTDRETRKACCYENGI